MNWAASEWGANGAPYVYNGTTRPLPVAGDYIGQRIMVANAAVPRGVSRLEWTGSIWAPPSGELIVGIWGNANPVALVTPGVTSLTKIYESPVIQDYMLPDGVIARVDTVMCAINVAGVGGCILGVGICGAIPSGQNIINYPANASIIPDNIGGVGISGASYYLKRKAGNFVHSGVYTTGRNIDTNTCGPYNSGACKLYAMAKPSGVADQIRFDGASVISMGAL